MSATLTSGLAELLDSRADTRDMLSSSPNLAHACLLLGRGELDLARRELSLGLKEDNETSRIIGQCISAELLRMEGDDDGAWLAAVACATENRFHSVAALYLKLLFPLAKVQEHAPVSAPAAMEPEDIAPPIDAHPVLTPPAPFNAPLEPPLIEAPCDTKSGFPEGWERVLSEGCLTGMRLQREGSVVNHGADLSGLSPLLTWLENDLFPRTQMGTLHHSAFEGSDRVLHHWGRNQNFLTALLDTGTQASVLAARLGKAFHDLEEDCA